MQARTRLVAVVAPHLVIAAVALTHPSRLTVESAEHWQMMHTIAIPLFPLLALGPWLVARGVDRRSAIVVGVVAYVYACFYTALDIIAGVAAGAIKDAEAGGLGIIFPVASDLGDIGSYAHLIATALAAGLALRVAGLVKGLPGVVLVVVGSVMFWQEHIYRPWGVLAMVLLGVGWGWLLLLTQKHGSLSLSKRR